MLLMPCVTDVSHVALDTINHFNFSKVMVALKSGGFAMVATVVVVHIVCSIILMYTTCTKMLQLIF